MLSLFAFPTGAQHVATRTAFKITQVAESIIPTYWTHFGKSITIRCLHAIFILVIKQTIKITAINICVQQFFIAHCTLGQGLSLHHSQSYVTHVGTIPVLIQCHWCINTSASGSIYVLFKVLCRFSAGTTHASFGLWTQISVCPRCHAQGIGSLSRGRHSQ